MKGLLGGALLILGLCASAFYGWGAWLWWNFSQIIRLRSQWELGWGILPEFAASVVAVLVGLALLVGSFRRSSPF